MINRKVVTGGALAIGLSLGFGIGSLRAQGVPQTNPLLYSGTLTEAGQPVTGTRNMRISLWRDETSTMVADRTCETVANNTPIEAGRFRVALDATCVTAVHAEPEQWVELEVAGTIIGSRAKVGAVPYALEADSASAAVGALDTRIGAIEAASPNRSAFRAYKTAVQSIPNNANTPLVYEAVEFNDGDDFDLATDLFTVELPGYYEIGCTATWASAGSAYYQVRIEAKPAAGVFAIRLLGGITAASGTRSARTLLKLGVGDQVRCATFQNSGVPVNLDAGSGAYNVFEAIRISP